MPGLRLDARLSILEVGELPARGLSDQLRAAVFAEPARIENQIVLVRVARFAMEMRVNELGPPCVAAM